MIPWVLILPLLACNLGFTDPSREFAEPLPAAEKQGDVYHQLDPMGVWHAPLTEEGDEPSDLPKHAACVACHGPNPKNFAKNLPKEEFHTNIEITHGKLTCDHCHDQDRTLLHLADATTFPYSEVMTLCRQCHGFIYKDFVHGIHGGAEGYWDTTRGPRVRNNCVDCHPPHSPAIEPVMPVFPPRDRYQNQHQDQEGHHVED